MAKEITRRFFFASAGGGILNTLQPFLPTLIGGSVLGVAYACPDGDPPPPSSGGKKKKINKFSQFEFERLSSGQLFDLSQAVFQYKIDREGLKITGFSNSFGKALLALASRHKHKRLVRKWIKKMRKSPKSKTRRAYLRAEKATVEKIKLDFLRASRDLFEKKLKAKNQSAKDKIDRQMHETNTQFHRYDAAAKLLSRWIISIKEGQLKN